MLGREAERAQIEQALDRLPAGPVTVTLEGMPGIGKTTLWRAAVEGARRRGYAVRATAPREPDADVGFAALGDVFDDLPRDVLAQLPDPQRRALSRALLIDDEDDESPDARALPRAVLTLLRALSASAPVLVAIDDEQWVDRASARVLAFALSRLSDEPIGVLMTRRRGTDGVLWDEVARDGHARVVRLSVGPLDPPSLDALLQERLGQRLPHRVRRCIQATSGGNPLYALAIGRNAEERPSAGPHVPIPQTLAGAIRRQLEAVVDRRLYEPLLAVAASSEATPALLQAVGSGFRLSDLEPALQGGIVEIVDDRVRFTHPLLGSTHYAGAPAERRRALHRRLADLSEDPQQRARHLALGAEAPDHDAAAAIEQGAEVAARRGAAEIAADLIEQAARLTPAEGAQLRRSRLLRAAELQALGGDHVRCRHLLQEILPELPPGRMRAHALLVLAEVGTDWDSTAAALKEAVEVAHDDHSLCARAEELAAGVSSNRADFVAMERHARAALDHATRSGIPELVAQMLGMSALAAFFTGRPFDLDRLREATTRADPRMATSRDSPAGALALILFWSDDHARGRPALQRAIARAREHGEQFDLGCLLFELGVLEFYAGNMQVADGLIAESRETSGGRGDPTHDLWLLCGEAMFAARRGELDQARRHAEQAVDLARATSDPLMGSFPVMVLASVDLWTGQPLRAHERLQPLRTGFQKRGFGFVGSLMFELWTIDIEALVACGRIEDAASVVDGFRRRCYAADNPNAVAVAERCDALVRAARDDLPGALERLHVALTAHSQRLLRPELARTLLETGIVQRRLKQKTAAKRSLEHALDIFHEIGAEMWSERTGDELRRIGLRRTTAEGLTPAQVRVAELVCTGLSNQEIAGTLHMSPRSVESHLTKVYRELGIRSRAQLAAALASRGEPVSGRST